jgi:general secretion pathway protein A
MFKSFFKLERDPFEISPDPEFLFPTSWHSEALAGLYYGAKSRKGIMVLTGEVGTGKTLVVRCLLNMLSDMSGMAYAYVFNTRMDSQDFLRYVARDLGIDDPPQAKADLLFQLSSSLVHRHSQGLLTLLLVDEAQNLSGAVLEEVRLLANLETPKGKILQIILAGQPELSQRLESHSLRQIKQRIALRFHLQPLSESLTFGYIQRRLKLAGDKNGSLFPPVTAQRVYLYSGGIPRLVNIICNNCLIGAFACGQSKVTPPMVDEVASDLHLRPVNGTKPSDSIRPSTDPGPKAHKTT